MVGIYFCEAVHSTDDVREFGDIEMSISTTEFRVSELETLTETATSRTLDEMSVASISFRLPAIKFGSASQQCKIKFNVFGLFLTFLFTGTLI